MLLAGKGEWGGEEDASGVNWVVLGPPSKRGGTRTSVYPREGPPSTRFLKKEEYEGVRAREDKSRDQ